MTPAHGSLLAPRNDTLVIFRLGSSDRFTAGTASAELNHNV
jgi:hypothetical protein